MFATGRRVLWRVATWGVCAAALGSGGPASGRAQEATDAAVPLPPEMAPTSGDAAPPAAPPALEPPQVSEGVEAAYPPAALAERREAVVGLRILVDAEGKVQEAEVVESAGPEFDEP